MLIVINYSQCFAKLSQNKCELNHYAEGDWKVLYVR